jgi:hypothetical protein
MKVINYKDVREARQIFQSPGKFRKNFNVPLDALCSRWLYGGPLGGFMGGMDNSDGSVFDDFHLAFLTWIRRRRKIKRINHENTKKGKHEIFLFFVFSPVLLNLFSV